jgi:hypothetical protein
MFRKIGMAPNTAVKILIGRNIDLKCRLDICLCRQAKLGLNADRLGGHAN